MKLLMRIKKAAIVIAAANLLIVLILGGIFLLKERTEKTSMVMGAVLLKDKLHEDQKGKYDVLSQQEINERYFRPSELTALNVNVQGEEMLKKFYDVPLDNIELPKDLLKKPWETILNYFSILREAAYMEEGKTGGCGTVGWGGRPYPIAYNFLSDDLKNKLPFDDYLKSFKGIAHINLIKLRNISNENTHENKLKYFIELETLKPSETEDTRFAYYYGYIYLKLEKGLYKISNVELYGEDFLCAAYHGWRHNAEYYVDITYGNWCKLIEKRMPTIQEGYIKNIDIKGTDGKEYRFQFVQITNGVDIEVGQYVKDESNKWKGINIDPEKCLKDAQ